MDQSHADDNKSPELNRRSFHRSALAIAGTVTASTGIAHGDEAVSATEAGEPSIIGGYGEWAAGLASDPPTLSFRRQDALPIERWRASAMAKATELIATPVSPPTPTPTITASFRFDGLEIQELQWEQPYGHPTKAVVLKPVNATGKLPAILGLHDHGGNKYFGKRKITRTGRDQHPLMGEHQTDYYGGLAWANEIAKRGYVVMVHDAFAFASRRVLFEDMKTIPWGGSETEGHSDDDPESVDSIRAYNDWATEHEHIMAKSLFCAGTTWPGVFLGEDQTALSVLIDRDDVDGDRVGCAGLSGGGLRTVYLGGLDHRVRCAVCVGFMSTWRDFLMTKAYTHTWMAYAPLLPNHLDFPEILGLRVPLPTMVQSDNDDPLYTMPEMQRADTMLADIYRKAGATDRYVGKFYPGGHKFDGPMQSDAFDWFDRWLG